MGRTTTGRGRAMAVASVWLVSAVAAAIPPPAAGAAPTSGLVSAVSSPASLLVVDAMTRHEVGGWGVSSTGGPWSLLATPARFGVDGSAGTVVAVPGSRSAAMLTGAVAADSRTLVRVVVPRLPTVGTLQLAVVTRAAGARRYEQRLAIDARGRAQLVVVRIDGGSSTRIGQIVPLPHPVRPGQQLDLRVQTAAASPVVLAARVWPSGSAEPSWQLVARDRSPSRLRAAGAMGLAVSLQPGGAARTVRVDGVLAVDLTRRGISVHDPAPVPSPSPSPAPSATTPAAPAPAPSAAPPPAPSPSPAPAPSPAPVQPPPSSLAPTTPIGERPTAATTGVPAGTTLTTVTGDIVVTTPGTVLDGLDVHGFVIVKAADVVIRRSVIRGGTATGNIGLITADDPAVRNLRIEDTDLVPDVPSVWVDGIKGANFTASRVDVRGTVDAVKVYGDHVRVEASFLHDTVLFDHDPNQHGGPTHNDGVQVLSGTDVTIVGNDIQGGDNAALQVTQDHGAVSGLVFDGNWVDGGGCSVNLSSKGLPSMSGLTVDQNRFGRHTRYDDCAILGTRQTSFDADGNVWDDDGSPVRVRRNG